MVKIPYELSMAAFAKDHAERFEKALLFGIPRRPPRMLMHTVHREIIVCENCGLEMDDYPGDGLCPECKKNGSLV